jgi:hypothetical protein
MRDLKDVLEPLGTLHPGDRWSEVSERRPRRLPPEPPRSRTGVYALAVGAAALLVVIALVLSPLGGRREREPARAGEAPPAWLVERAYRFAYASGDITPTAASWAFAGMDVIGPAVGIQDGDPAVREYLVVLRGGFTGYWAKVPPGADLARGDRLAFAVDPQTREVTDSSIGIGDVDVSGLEPFELPPASAAITSRDGWMVTEPPGWRHGSLVTNFGPDALEGTWIANRPASSLSKAAGGAATPAQFSADGFPRDAIALVIVPSGSASAASGVTILTPPLAIDDLAAGSSVGGSALDVAWITDGERTFSVTVRTGDAVTAVDRAAIADVIASLRFDTDATARSVDAVTVPDVVGLTQRQAANTLASLGLTVQPRERTAQDSDVPIGSVMVQDPAAGASVDPGTSITLVVFAGSEGGISVGRLPQAGIVVSDGDRTTLLDTDGTVLATLPGYHLTGNPGAPGVWLESGARSFMLDPAAGAVVPVARETARASMYDEGPEPDLAPPANATVGHWRYQLFPAAGIASLAQWSGECEAATAYWIDGDGSERIVTGERSRAEAPESIALGWTSDGAALVLRPEGACGPHRGVTGIYSYTAPGRGKLEYETAPDASAEMWDVP